MILKNDQDQVSDFNRYSFPKITKTLLFQLKTMTTGTFTLNSELEPKVFESELKYSSPDSDLNPKINDKVKKKHMSDPQPWL
jgi:hypothetical protein